MKDNTPKHQTASSIMLYSLSYTRSIETAQRVRCSTSFRFPTTGDGNAHLVSLTAKKYGAVSGRIVDSTLRPDTSPPIFYDSETGCALTYVELDSSKHFHKLLWPGSGLVLFPSIT